MLPSIDFVRFFACRLGAYEDGQNSTNTSESHRGSKKSVIKLMKDNNEEKMHVEMVENSEEHFYELLNNFSH